VRAKSNATETILVVDDEPVVRKLITEMLALYGYKVLVAQDGRDALRVADTHADPIHLLLTDMVMPEMNGDELAEHLSQMRPQMRIVMMSGYSDERQLQRVVETGIRFLQKPFSPVSLTKAIRETLDEPWRGLAAGQ
jgi:two-component system cell cycle sensor histidine kinase/response regulator CckA